MVNIPKFGAIFSWGGAIIGKTQKILVLFIDSTLVKIKLLIKSGLHWLKHYQKKIFVLLFIKIKRCSSQPSFNSNESIVHDVIKKPCIQKAKTTKSAGEDQTDTSMKTKAAKREHAE